ncbi:hypothetical protein GXW74_18140 [Roseomonas eburnea]|uniref:Uncharacterized protein n=1 Tax=Neoroseomonas eburnea TaxID=1346889 RepID=A0A9X9XFD2_9PROT|nr:hypothetical protein [Neoroseomonas eburnea]MBR0682418.1 hypothetical protein [Neoroseomonas eburnea]
MRRLLPLHLLVLVLAACAAVTPAQQGPAERHAALVAAADQGLGRMIDHLALRERTEIDQAASLRFAAGGAVPRSLAAPAAPVAGAVLDPGMDLLVMEARRLAALAAGAAPTEGPEAAVALARLEQAVAALRGVPARWPSEAVRRRGLDAFRLLAAPAPAGVDAARLAADRQSAVVAGIALLRQVLGEESRAGLRGVLAQRHEAWRAAQRGVLEAARNDRSLTPADRMAMWNRVQAAMAGDPPDVAANEAAVLLAALPAAHAAAGAGDVAGVAAFEAALARFQGVLAQAR